MKYHRIGQPRLWALLGGVFLLFVIISWRLADVAWWRHSWYAQTAAAQANGIANVLVRGKLYMSDRAGGEYLAVTNHRFPVAQVIPAQVDTNRLETTATALAEIIESTPEVFLKAVRAGGSKVRILARRLTDQQAAAVTALHASGVSIAYETDRWYPLGDLAAEVLGFYGFGGDGMRTGQYGIEAAYEEELSGRSGGIVRLNIDLFGQIKRLLGKDNPRASSDTDRPHDVILTIDKNVQAHAQTVLEEVLAKYGAPSGTVIVQEPATGRILALADRPTFDPNTYGSAPVESFLNGALQAFEPGSSFKPFTMAIGLDAGVITPTSTYNDNHDIVVDGYTIKNFNESHFGLVTMTKVLEKSVNAGTMYVQSLLSHDQFLRGVVDLGLGQRSGIDLPGEAAGDINNLYSGRNINFMTASFGQGITVTPLQLINGYSAIANGGKLMRPQVVAAIRDEDGRVQELVPELIGTPFTAQTAQKLRTMLVSVVDNGFDKARVPHYDVAGKTGTAQIASPKGGYLEGEYNHSFVGFAPASNPRFTILIKIEKPQGITFAADSLSPAFRDMTMYLLNYYSVPPTR